MPDAFTKRRGVWMHSIGCDWEMRERGRECSCGLIEAWEAEQAQLRAIWVDGPDSEAARACEYRLSTEQGRAVHRALVASVQEDDFVGMSEPDYRAMPDVLARRRLLAEWSRAYANRHRDEGFELDDDFTDYVFRHAFRLAREARTPDPDHIPAVRRVVRWEPVHTQWGVTSPPALEAEQVRWAYIKAALALIERANLRAGDRSSQVRRYFSHGQGRWVPNERHPRVLKLAAALRHRDEEAGYR